MKESSWARWNSFIAELQALKSKWDITTYDDGTLYIKGDKVVTKEYRPINRYEIGQ